MAHLHVSYALISPQYMHTNAHNVTFLSRRVIHCQEMPTFPSYRLLARGGQSQRLAPWFQDGRRLRSVALCCDDRLGTLVLCLPQALTALINTNDAGFVLPFLLSYISGCHCIARIVLCLLQNRGSAIMFINSS